MIKAIIIEDEPQLRETNELLLRENFPDVSIEGVAGTVGESIKMIQEINPQLVLCDIQLEDGNCFQVLQNCKPYTFRPVFITAYNQFAIKAIKFSAIDYILKPVNEFEFCDAIQKAIASIHDAENNAVQTETFISNYQGGSSPKKVVLRTAEAMHIVRLDEILYCKSDNSYTSFYLRNKKEITVSKSIKEYAELFAEYHFLRPHQSFLVNLQHITKIDKTDGGFIIMENGAEIPISSRRKQALFDELERL